MEASEIIVSRAGAMTVTEIANIGKPSILIPLPNVSHNHQQYNAEVLSNAGAAKILKNDDSSGFKLHEQILEILNKDMLDKMGEIAKTLSIKDVENKIYKEIRRVIESDE